MQATGLAIDLVTAFFAATDSDNFSFVTQRYACLTPYRDFGVLAAHPDRYAALPDSARAVCRADLEAVADLITGNRPTYEAVSGASGYARALHAARLLQQWEAYAALPASAGGAFLRDRFMAENVEWLLDQARPNARMMLWAHNQHGTKGPGLMGRHLPTELGADYVNVAQLFGTGAFYAVEQDPRGFGPLQVFQARLVPNNSLERVFTAVGHSLLFDARLIPRAATPPPCCSGPSRCARSAPHSSRAGRSATSFRGCCPMTTTW